MILKRIFIFIVALLLFYACNQSQKEIELSLLKADEDRIMISSAHEYIYIQQMHNISKGRWRSSYEQAALLKIKTSEIINLITTNSQHLKDSIEAYKKFIKPIFFNHGIDETPYSFLVLTDSVENIGDVATKRILIKNAIHLLEEDAASHLISYVDGWDDPPPTFVKPYLKF